MTTSSGTGGTGGDAGAGGDIIFPAGSSGTGGGMACNPGLPDKDNDGDGFTENEGDCNDCDKNVNPNAVEVPTPEVVDGGPDAGPPMDPADEDCDGMIDEAPTPCDTGLMLNSEEPLDATKAIGMCQFVKTAKWVLADGSPIPADATKLANFHLGHGIMAKFGTNNKPREGANMLMLSSGTARDKTSAESVYRTFDKGYTSNAPFGFPKPSAACPGVTTGLPHDATGVQIEMNVPTNAQSASFDFQFFTYEWHDYICKQFNDFFVAHVEPFPMGQMDGNVAFDGMKNPISVNNGFFDVCAPKSCNVCPAGIADLQGTGMQVGNQGGATKWLFNDVPTVPGEIITLDLIIFDVEDSLNNSLTLLDNWKWNTTVLQGVHE